MYAIDYLFRHSFIFRNWFSREQHRAFLFDVLDASSIQAFFERVTKMTLRRDERSIKADLP
jgi:hypothetical protein